ncbi:hypothetical protein [Limnochorda pilosa]|uniref:Tripartite tricarboxylate transporter TctB family protein n=1 Tax=Limnochorda pilosa TaxID=1555112 RepID=A0A0K2SHS6_LIMPI|nr:hypothetical protein [Limnochorda pilosa]BAS26656.1 hypothetical protein LIP_0799 [Limnochorda pilosa]
MISAALFTLGVAVYAYWEGAPLWRNGYQREAVAGWALWFVGLVLGNLLILLDPPPDLAPFLDRIFDPVGRLLTGG